MPKQELFVIRTPGKRDPVRGITPLLTALKKCYRGHHVSVERQQPSGIRHITFVSISADGQLMDTYNESEINRHTFADEDCANA
ncbi:hypothetical protein IC617_08325 [Neiella sp. HB171785]|uniref:Uncharacterized protein n=1 Tax=Neiella litorisoli TaxID=2771431 RepID=A0A8J6ULS0_9GAMM|nr:hypothetical protein [Neiella litorisoli]MBD1389430.1 hypothetical protein [Neiella litorisoli]